jgi:hypothetical protein
VRWSLVGLTTLAAFAACAGEKAENAASTVPALTVADTGATINPPAELSMDVQHRTMDSVQRNYVALLTAVSSRDKEAASQAANNIASLSDRIPAFMIHKAGVTADSLTPWSRMMKGQALRAAQLAQVDSIEAVEAMVGQLTGSCTVCHEMYREGGAAAPAHAH